MDIAFEVAEGEFCILLGPSGCGKSTILRLIAGLEQPSTGEIAIDGRRIDGLPPRQRDIAFVFQNYALYPHMTVFDNLAFSLRMRVANERYRPDSNGGCAVCWKLTTCLRRRRGLAQRRPAPARRLGPSDRAPAEDFSSLTSRYRTWTRRCAQPCASSWRGCIAGSKQRSFT